MSIWLLLIWAHVSACSPIKGYDGPDLPDEQVAVLAIASSDFDHEIQRATVRAMEFNTRGIALLPGKHEFQLSAAHGEPPYDCWESTTFDSYGYDQCMREREQDIRENKKHITYCSASTYEKRFRNCRRDFNDFNCDGAAALDAGKRYEVDVPPTAARTPVVTLAVVTGGFLKKDRSPAGTIGKCDFVRKRTEDVQYSLN